MKQTILALSLASTALPADVTAFIERTDACIHWSNEPVDSEPASEPRRREIDSAMKELRCDRIVSDAARLRQRYITSPPVVKAIDEERKKFE